MREEHVPRNIGSIGVAQWLLVTLLKNLLLDEKREKKQQQRIFGNLFGSTYRVPGLVCQPTIGFRVVVRLCSKVLVESPA
jgi:hypothetical protein